MNTPPSDDAIAVSEIYFDSHDRRVAPSSAIGVAGLEVGGDTRVRAADFLQIRFALQGSATPETLLDALTSDAWQSSLYATSMDFGRQTFSDPFVSAPQPPPTNPTPVPEPASLLLFGSGLAGLAGLARRLRRRKAR